MQDILLPAVRQAMALCQQVQQQIVVRSEKAGSEPVTIADYGSQALICRAIQAAFPEDAVIAEESGDQFTELVATPERQAVIRLLGEILGEPVSEAQVIDWLNFGRERQAPRTWTIDPVDGTKGFLKLRRYCIAVALIEQGHVTEGILGCPEYVTPQGKGLLFYTHKGAAYAQGDDRQARAIQVSTRTATLQVVESVEGSHVTHQLLHETYAEAGLEVAHLEQFDGQDKYAMIAAGDADLYVRVSARQNYAHKIWDHAAGTVLVLAAGGTVTDPLGQPLDFSQGSYLPNKGMVISNGLIHTQVMAVLPQIIQRYPPE